MKRTAYSAAMAMAVILILLPALWCSGADEVLDSYMDQVSDYRREIISKASAVKLAAIASQSQNRQENLEARHRGYVPDRVKTESYRAQDSMDTAEKDFEAVEREITRFKAEVTKYYRGKTPKKLKEGISQLLSNYYETKTDVYRSVTEMRRNQ